MINTFMVRYYDNLFIKTVFIEASVKGIARQKFLELYGDNTVIVQIKQVR